MRTVHPTGKAPRMANWRVPLFFVACALVFLVPQSASADSTPAIQWNGSDMAPNVSWPLQLEGTVTGRGRISLLIELIQDDTVIFEQRGA